MNQLAMEEADAYMDCSWEAIDYDEEGTEEEGEDVDQEQEAEFDSYQPSTQRCTMVSNLSHSCPVKLFHNGCCKYVM